MKTKIRKLNPFKNKRLEHAYVWEKVYDLNLKKNNIKCLDYGGHDGMLIEELLKSNVINNGFTVDLNIDVINKNKNSLSKNHKMFDIKKGESLPFEKEYFDLITIVGVIEHVYDQNSLLKEIYRVLKPDGRIIIAVPGKHLFSFLDFGNWKFIFPVFHKWYIVKKYGYEYYDYHYVKCANGLIGDVEKEKAWHEHFTHKSLNKLLLDNRIKVTHKDGFGFFYRIFHNIKWLLPSTKIIFNLLIKIDSKIFSSAEIFIKGKKIDENFRIRK